MNSDTARLIAEDLARASDLAFDKGDGRFSSTLGRDSDKMYEFAKELGEREKEEMVNVPLSLLKRLADNDWGPKVADDYPPWMEAPDGSGSHSSFTVGDLREVARIVNEVEK